MKKFILASGSPRRIEMLKKWGFEFTIQKAKFNERKLSSPFETVLYNAYGKAFSVAKKFKNEVVVGADTIVVINKKILGKPNNEKDLFDMLTLLSGKKHYVLTGIAAIEGNKFVTDICKTEVGFKKLDKSEIQDYIKTGEGNDKAGGYAVQGLGASFIEKINGPLDNVIGLPINTLKKILKIIER